MTELTETNLLIIRQQWESEHSNPRSNREPIPTYISENNRMFIGWGKKAESYCFRKTDGADD